nr:MAG TPA: hypothetical protein [Bacteriophage sp.]DAT77357.1 MAG TPA: hypothetical protein [Caudoviricetes sp.]
MFFSYVIREMLPKELQFLWVICFLISMSVSCIAKFHQRD